MFNANRLGQSTPPPEVLTAPDTLGSVVNDSEKPAKALNDRSGFIKPVFRSGDIVSSFTPWRAAKSWLTNQTQDAATLARGRGRSGDAQRLPEFGREETKKQS